MKGYEHRECGCCGTEIGFSEQFIDHVEYVVCTECDAQLKAEKHAKDKAELLENLGANSRKLTAADYGIIVK